MLSEWFGPLAEKQLAPIARRIPFSPNTITIAGLLITAAAAAVIPIDLIAGGLLILAGGLFDMLDGLVARLKGQRSVFGAFLDSTIDRYSDSLLIIGVSWYFYNEGNIAGVLLAAGALVGSLITSYARARAEGLGLECRVGIMERPERVVLIALGCLTGLLFPAIIAIFAMSHITVMQRIAHVYKKLQ